MKAIVYTKYGSPDFLKLKEVEKPTPKDSEVLVKIDAASVNSWDWDLVLGKPYLSRFPNALFKPKNCILGIDIAGIVKAVGKNVTQFKLGDEVFGDISECGFGAFAEYTCAHEKALLQKPASMSFEEAAALPHVGGLAVQGLCEKGGLKAGQKILINGAGGGVGTIGIQIAKHIGTEVTCVDSSEKFEMLSSLGADHLIDYTKENFTENGKQYDLILDNKAHHSVFAYKRALTKTGILVIIGGKTRRILQTALLGPIITMGSPKKMGLLFINQIKG